MSGRAIARPLFVLMLAAAPAAWSQPAPFKDPGDALGWMNSYYQHPNPARVPEALGLVADGITPELAPPRVAALVRLFALALKDQPALWPGVEQQVTGTPERQRFVQRVLDQARKPQPVVLADPADLDLLWMDYFITGSQEPINRLLDLAVGQGAAPDISGPFWTGRKVTDPKQAANIMRVTAAWSLASNLKNHWALRAQIKNRQDTASDPIQRRLLTEILDNKVSVAPPL